MRLLISSSITEMKPRADAKALAYCVAVVLVFNGSALQLVRNPTCSLIPPPPPQLFLITVIDNLQFNIYLGMCKLSTHKNTHSSHKGITVRVVINPGPEKEVVSCYFGKKCSKGSKGLDEINQAN